MTANWSWYFTSVTKFDTYSTKETKRKKKRGKYELNNESEKWTGQLCLFQNRIYSTKQEGGWDVV